MEYSIQQIDGIDLIVITDGANTHCIHMEAVASWGVLLGLTDEGEILDSIVADAQNKDLTIDWSSLYTDLNANLRDTSNSGVPVEFIETLLDPLVTSPVPGKARKTKLKGTRESELAKIRAVGKGVDKTIRTKLKDELKAKHAGKISKKRLEFLDTVAPLVTVGRPLPADWDDPLSVR
jgi:hypothetical protein